MGLSARTEALDIVVAAVLDGMNVAPAQLARALAAIGFDGNEAPVASEALHRASIDVARLRQRGRELGELFSSARELAEVRDSMVLLERLVGRAHEMMECDVAYLSVLNAETMELQVRTTVGVVSPEFQHLHVSAGRGLVSEIVESREARWVKNYSAYTSTRHDAPIDHAVQAEGLVSLLGVPMLTGANVLGVLFVATRRETTFTPEQVSLLAALADHASVVLQTANMFQSLRDSEDEARETLEQLTRHLTERDRANTVHQELVQAVLRGGGFEQIAATLSEALSRTVSIVDVGGRLLADSRGPGHSLGDAMSELTEAGIERSRVSGHFEGIQGDSDVGGVAAMMAGRQTLGSVLVGRGERSLESIDERTVERASQVCALLELQLTAVIHTERRLQSDIVTDLLQVRSDRIPDVERRARSFDVVLHDLDRVHLFVVPGGARPTAVRRLMELVRHHGLVGEDRGYLIAVVASRHAELDPSYLRSQLSTHTRSGVLCVTAPPVSSPLRFADSFVVAMRTARLLEAIGITDTAVNTDEYLPYAAVFDPDPRALAAFLADTIGAVRNYDQERGSELMATLRAFVRCNASPTRTARVLQFHTNTVLQRLERLSTILGENWREDERFFRISLAVRLDEIREGMKLAPGEPA